MEMNEFVASIEIPKKKPISVTIYEQLLQAIIEGRLKEGERIIESQLARVFGVSRPPIREALQMLEMEGFLELIPYKGFIVSQNSIQETRETLEIKAMVEGFAAWKGAKVFGPKDRAALESILQEMEQCIREENTAGVQEANFNFHNRILAGIGNEKMYKYYQTLFNTLRRLYTIGLTGQLGPEDSLKEHRQILQKITDQDPAGAETCARQHAMNTIERVLKKMRKHAAA